MSLRRCPLLSVMSTTSVTVTGHVNCESVSVRHCRVVCLVLLLLVSVLVLLLLVSVLLLLVVLSAWLVLVACYWFMSLSMSGHVAMYHVGPCTLLS